MQTNFSHQTDSTLDDVLFNLTAAQNALTHTERLNALRVVAELVDVARDEAILDARQDGLGLGHIAGALGLTRQRVHQIVKPT